MYVCARESVSKHLPVCVCVCVHWGEQVSFACGVERKVAAAAAAAASTSASLYASRTLNARGRLCCWVSQFLQRRRVSWLRFLSRRRVSERVRERERDARACRTRTAISRQLAKRKIHLRIRKIHIPYACK